MTKRMIIGVVVLMIALAGCGSSSGGSDSTKTDKSSDSANPGSSDKGSGDASGCNGYENGKDGVVRTFCDGSAKVSFDIGGTKGSIDGGECSTSGGYFSVNAGVVVDATFTGTKPDYAGFLLPTASGDFTNDGVTASITTGGEATVIRNVTGTHDDNGGSFEGTSMVGDTKVSVTFTC